MSAWTMSCSGRSGFPRVHVPCCCFGSEIILAVPGTNLGSSGSWLVKPRLLCVLELFLDEWASSPESP
ncbi:hypothetical protein I7I53_01865 [Histoplasma capsulatum var. duboisii H88]|uniref:Uncharacterized protein n=1 Tax=Ajellomyces capsulatus (strain H88) TaxID=544711 RepID=A0A8A1LJ07_AJEC8|nr:hypothetical protein I7I53_01865 [Histoplasma capsulatum var. duboisii H88]